MKKLRPYQQQAVNECWQALKKDDKPVLLMASVGAGKSLMLASILLTIQNSGKKALCLVNNAELVRNNSETFNNQGGKSSIYCASLGEKNVSNPIIFGTPQTVLNGINKNEEIGKIKFNIIVVDEAHTINYINHRSSFMCILRHYKSEYQDMRLLGATGTNFRFKGSAIVGEKSLFKTQVGNITTEKLIDDGYLIKPCFEIDPKLVIDFSKVKIKSNGLFDAKDLEKVVDNNTRLTKLICNQIIHIMNSQNRFGVFLFATTKKHAYEILSYLPEEESAIILGETPQHERHEILEKARKGKIRFLVNIAIISVGVDIPAFDTLAYLRPTESLVLLVQTMGRCLRLSDVTNKHNALILDFAGNIDRHRDWDNPLLLEAVAKTIDKDYPLVIQCPACQCFNTENARRCVGIANEKRCDYYFEFKECINCNTKNDIVSRHCHHCNAELINPNDKLSINILTESKEVYVISAKYIMSGGQRNFRISCFYKFTDDNGIIGTTGECFYTANEKTKNIFYGNFVKKHCEQPSKWYMHLNNRKKVEEMLQSVSTPIKMIVSNNKIKKKIFE